jgi:hypothetical protein
MKRAVLILIRAYQLVISPLLPPSCRFYPSCSEYAREAVVKWGVWRGMVMSAKRVARCHPFGGHGFDPVPEVRCQVPGARCQGGSTVESAQMP